MWRPSHRDNRVHYLLMAMNVLETVFVPIKCFENTINGRMVDGTIFTIRQQVLLTHIRDIARFRILGEQMVKGLIPPRPNIFWDRGIPFFAIGKNRINIKHNPSKIKDSVTNDLPHAKAGAGDGRRAFGAIATCGCLNVTHVF